MPQPATLIDSAGALMALGLFAGGLMCLLSGEPWAGGGLCVGSISILIATTLHQLLQAQQNRLQHMLKAMQQVQEGAVHVYIPEGEGVPGQLARHFNQLQDRIRSSRLHMTEAQILDQAMVRESPNGLVITDQEGRIRRYNPSMLALLPSARILTGRRASEAFPLPELAAVLEETARTRTLSEQSATFERRDLLVRAQPLADGAGCLGVVLDVTSVRQAERARRDFVANVSHELRTPITAISGYAESLLDEREALPEYLVPMLQAIDRNARRLSALVEDVLHLSKIEGRSKDLPLESEVLAPLVAEVVERLSAQAQDRGIKIEVQVPPLLEARVNAEAFEHALGNLIDNAIKYSPLHAKVMLRVQREAERVRIEVQDQGPGIAAEHHARIFERFYRVDPGRSRAIGGTGLGLALVKHLCQAMQAEVSVESVPEQGSTFILHLPVEPT